MLYTIPDYYHEFSCIAGECEDTCCAGWQIVADEAALKKYKKAEALSDWTAPLLFTYAAGEREACKPGSRGLHPTFP